MAAPPHSSAGIYSDVIFNDSGQFFLSSASQDVPSSDCEPQVGVRTGFRRTHRGDSSSTSTCRVSEDPCTPADDRLHEVSGEQHTSVVRPKYECEFAQLFLRLNSFVSFQFILFNCLIFHYF